MTNSLEKKLRKIFRKKQREYFWLGFKGDKYQLAEKLPLKAYEGLEEDLTDDELYELKSIFEAWGLEEKLITVIPNDLWFDRCISNLKLFDSFSDKQLEKILNDECNSLIIFVAQGITRNQQYRIMHLIHQNVLEKWVCWFEEDEFSEFSRFLVWLYEKERDEEYASEKEKATEIFQKITNLSDFSISRLLQNQNIEKPVTKRILKGLKQMDRDIFAIYKLLDKSCLYEALKRSDFYLLDNADEEVYSWLYSNLLDEERKEFLAYLADTKRDKMVLFNTEICVGIYNLPMVNSRELAKEVIVKKGLEEFNDFYEALPLEEKEEILRDFVEDEKGVKVIGYIFEGKENLGLFETLIKEKYVTQK